VNLRPTLEALYRRLLVLYPARFRDLYEEDMAEFFHDRMMEASRTRGTAGAVAAFGRALADLVTSALRERCSSPRRRTFKGEKHVLDGFRADLKAAMRSVASRPGLALAAAATLALGLGAATLVFTVVDAILLRPLPFEDPERLVMIWNRYDTSSTSSSPPDYVDRRSASRLLSSMAAIATGSMNLSGDLEARNVEVSRVTASFFQVLGVTPSTGPVSFPSEVPTGEAEEARLAVLGPSLWRSAFGSDPAILGRVVRLDGTPHQVVGVMPEGFDFPPGTEVYVPLVFRPEQLADNYRGNEFLQNLGRLAPGASLEAVSREMDAIAASVLTRVPARRGFLERNGWGARVVPLDEHLTGSARPALVVLSFAVLLVLLATCANLSSMILASVSSRARDLAVRSSLGASRIRLLRQLVLESLLLTLLGSLLGLLLSFVVARGLPLWAPSGVPRLETVALDARGIAFAVIVALGAGLASALVPAWQASSGRLHGALRLGRSVSGSSRLRSALVVTEVALALLLSIGVGLLVRSFERLTRVDPGFEPAGRVSMRITMPATQYREPADRIELTRRLLETIAVVPGVSAVAASDRVPLDGGSWTGTFHPDGYTAAPGEPTPGGDMNLVSPGYLKTLGIPLLAGREFLATDVMGSPGVALVDERTAKRFWPQGAVGQRINLSRPERPDFREVVGVVGHVKMSSLDEEGRFQVYLPVAQTGWSRRLRFTVSTAGSPDAVVASLRRDVASLAPELPLYQVRTLDDLVESSVSFRRFNLAVLGAFAVLALSLAAVGLYGVLSFSVSRRTAEIGIRMALGARAPSVFALVLREGVALVGLGCVLGAAAALALSRFLEGLLFQVAPTDLATFAVVTAGLLALSALAAFIPARRAAALDPVDALRVS
jgi:putative ABC transport system permease protein